MNTTTIRIARKAMIDLKPGTVYRRFANRDWHTVKKIECRHEAHGRIAVYVDDVEGGGWSAGSELLVETLSRENCDRCDSAEPGDVFIYHLRVAGNHSDVRRCRDCLSEGASFGVDEWLYRIEPDGTRTDNPFGVI